VNSQPPESFQYLATPQGYADFFAAFPRPSLLAVDTEAASFHRYRDRIYLVQVSTREQTAIIDPLAVPELDRLGALLADPGVEIVFHDADYDLRILHRDYGFTATVLFDTRIAAQLLNEPAIGLAALLEKYLEVRLDKKYQRADWSLRPLLPGMLEYAASDTRFLPRLRDILAERLRQMGRWHWAEEEFRLLENTRWSPAGPPEEAYLRIKGARLLKGQQLAVLRELFEWREATAGQLDRAPFRVLMNESMVTIAKSLPDDLEALRALRALSPDQLRRRGTEIMTAITRGREALPDSIPSFPRTRRPAPDPAYESRLERLKAARNLLAERLPLAPGVLCPNGLLEAIARLEAPSEAALKAIEGMRNWQREVLGAELLGAVKAG
jgi:ribonuclease D